MSARKRSHAAMLSGMGRLLQCSSRTSMLRLSACRSTTEIAFRLSVQKLDKLFAAEFAPYSTSEAGISQRG